MTPGPSHRFTLHRGFLLKGTKDGRKAARRKARRGQACLGMLRLEARDVLGVVGRLLTKRRALQRAACGRGPRLVSANYLRRLMDESSTRMRDRDDRARGVAAVAKSPVMDPRA